MGEMKRVYLMSYQRASNYGASLQLFALKTTIEGLGHSVQVIDYIADNMRLVPRNYSSWLSYCKRVLMDLFFRRIRKKFNLTADTYTSLHQLEALPKADVYIVGSDQVWNPAIHQNDRSFYLPFVPMSGKRIAYAASSGGHEYSTKQLELFASDIKRFDAISVREKSLQDTVRLMGLDTAEIPVVLDPTLLLDAEQYDVVRNKKKSNFKYIAVYSCLKDPAFYTVVRDLQKLTNLPVINLGYHFKGASSQEYMFGPGHWLDRISQAEFVLTNSFHGTVFSILYKKKFAVVPSRLQKELGLNGRFLDLLESIGLSDRVYFNSENNIADFISREINFNVSFVKLNERRQHSFLFLKKSLC